jgi:uncharacterized protein involved in tolerance to divalent cations
MKPASQFQIVLVTTPDLKTARSIAKAALSARLIACANLIPGLESHYRWQGKIERAREILMLIKTSRARIAALEKLVLKMHPYDTPEIVCMELRSSSNRYLKWLADSVG